MGMGVCERGGSFKRMLAARPQAAMVGLQQLGSPLGFLREFVLPLQRRLLYIP